MNNDTDNTSTGKAAKVWNSRPVAWTSAVILVLAVVVAAVMVVWSIVSPAEPEGQNYPAADSPSTSVAQGSTPAPNGACDVPEGDTALRPQIPTDLRWKAAQGLAWPVSDTYGPTQTKDGFDVCFARSPLGAALAATTFMYSQFDGHKGNEIIDFYVVDSPGKKIALETSGTAGDSSGYGELGLSVAGFIVNEFTPERVNLGLVFNLPESETGYMSIPTTLLWVDGDWRIKVLDTGGSGEPSTPVKGQFVEWGAING